MENLWVKYLVDGKKGYWVSDAGEIRSISTRSKLDGHVIFGKRIGQYIDKQGYMQIYLHQKTRKAHRIIAMAFISNPENKKYVNHKNGIKTDNRVENLEWCTNSENVRHAIKTGLWPTKLTDQDVLFIRKNFKELGKHVLAKKFNICAAYAYSIATHKDKYYIEGEVFQTSSPMFCKPIDQYDLSGALISRYPSIKAAAKAIGKKIGAVQRVIKGERRSLGGFVFKYATGTR